MGSFFNSSPFDPLGYGTSQTIDALNCVAPMRSDVLHDLHFSQSSGAPASLLGISQPISCCSHPQIGPVSSMLIPLNMKNSLSATTIPPPKFFSSHSTKDLQLGHSPLVRLRQTHLFQDTTSNS